MLARIRILLAITAAYAATGWVSMLVLVPAGYVAPVYPPAGIALGALILYGYRVWPAILVGALITNALATIHAGGEIGFGVLVSGIGASVQALFGAWLAARMLQLPDPLDTPRSIARLLFVVAPVSSLVNASLSVPVLAALGTLPAGDAAFSWVTWWLGDTLGALIALPLMFVFLARPGELWRPRRAAITVPHGRHARCRARGLSGRRGVTGGSLGTAMNDGPDHSGPCRWPQRSFRPCRR